MHGYDQTLKISKELSDCEIVDMKTNAQTHSEEMVIKLISFVRSFD